MLPSNSRDPQTKWALWLCMWEVERLYLEVPLPSGEGGFWDFEVSQQRLAQVTAVLQTNWSALGFLLGGQEWCLAARALPTTNNNIKKNSLVQREPQCPQAALHPLLSWKAPALMCRWCFSSSSPALQFLQLCKILLQLWLPHPHPFFLKKQHRQEKECKKGFVGAA